MDLMVQLEQQKGLWQETGHPTGNAELVIPREKVLEPVGLSRQNQ